MTRTLPLVALVLTALVLLYWALLYTQQRSILFPAPPAAGAPPRPPDALQVWLPTSVGRVEAWYLPPGGSSDGPAPLLIFTHGNGELIDYWPPAFVPPREWGMAVLLVEYPGYGRSEGRPTQASIAEAVAAAYDWAVTREEIDPDRVVLHGRSLGAGAAVLLAGARPVAALVLESSFTSVRAFARRMGAPGFLVRDRFDNIEGLGRSDAPLFIAHGKHDAIIPVAHAHALHAVRPGSELLLLPCGHNDCVTPWPAIGRFLRRQGVIATP